MTPTPYTKGPWGDPRKKIVVRGLTFLAHAHYETEEGDANAHLIMATPEMYEALRKVRATLVALAWDENTQIIEEIDGVISKAEGKL